MKTSRTWRKKLSSLVTVALCVWGSRYTYAFPADFANGVTTQDETGLQLKDLEEIQKSDVFTLNGVRIVSPLDFAGREAEEGKIVEKYLNKEISIGTLNKMAGEITKLYRDNGFLAAVAYVPPQKNKSGVVEIHVLEGVYDEIDLEFKTDISRSKVERVVSKLRSGDPVRKLALEDVLYKLNDIDGVKASGFLSPGKKEGSTNLKIILEKDKAARHIVYTDNYGNRSAGQYRLGLLNDFYNIDNSGTKLTVGGLLSTKNASDLYTDLSFLFPSKGVMNKLGIHIGYSRYKLGDEYRELDANGKLMNYSIYGTTTVRKTISSSVSYIYGINFNDMVDDIDAFGLNAEKHSYSMHVGVIGNERWKDNHFIVFQKFTAGHLVNDSDYANYINAFNNTEGVYYKLNTDLDYGYEINNRLDFKIHFSWQLASKNLDSSERMPFTGINGVKAYPSGDLSVDNGFLTRAILTYKTGIKNLSANIFYEHAEGTPRKSVDYKVSLNGWGIGLSYTKPDDYFIKLDYARRIGFDEILSERSKAKGRLWFIAGKIF